MLGAFVAGPSRCNFRLDGVPYPGVSGVYRRVHQTNYQDQEEPGRLQGNSMGLYRYALALSLLIGCAPFPPRFPDPDTTANSVFMVEVYDGLNKLGTGTAWIYSLGASDTYLITAGHVCSGDEVAKHFALVSRDGLVVTANEVYYSTSPDLCMLQVPGGLGYEIPLADRMPAYDEPVFTIGAPGGFFGDGSAPIFHGNWSGAGTFTGAGIPGQSGSPVLSAYGVVGVLTRGMAGQLATVEPLGRIRAFLTIGK